MILIVNMEQSDRHLQKQNEYLRFITVYKKNHEKKYFLTPLVSRWCKCPIQTFTSSLIPEMMKIWTKPTSIIIIFPLTDVNVLNFLFFFRLLPSYQPTPHIRSKINTTHLPKAVALNILLLRDKNNKNQPFLHESVVHGPWEKLITQRGCG